MAAFTLNFSSMYVFSLCNFSLAEAHNNSGNLISILDTTLKDLSPFLKKGVEQISARTYSENLWPSLQNYGTVV